MPDSKLADEVQKSVPKKLQKPAVLYFFMDKILADDLAGIQLMNKYNKNSSFFYVINVFQ